MTEDRHVSEGIVSEGDSGGRTRSLNYTLAFACRLKKITAKPQSGLSERCLADYLRPSATVKCRSRLAFEPCRPWLVRQATIVNTRTTQLSAELPK